jgi:CheY-like chemotaxis protein
MVEDSEPVRIVVKRLLSELGYHVLEAASAAAALEMLVEGKKFDLLFTDIVMPGDLDGLKLAELAVERRPSLKVLLTSGFPENKLDGQNGPMTGIRLLSKPYRKQELARVLREVFES